MGRILFFVIIGLVIWLVLRGVLRAQKRDSDAAAPSARTEDMVACARCGVHLPRSEARLDGGVFVCRDNPRCIPAK